VAADKVSGHKDSKNLLIEEVPMVRRKLMVGLLVGVMAMGLGAAAAHDYGHGEWMHRGPLGKLITGVVGRWMVLRSEMDLTDQQRRDIRKAVAPYRADLLKNAHGVWEKRNALRDAVLAEKPSEEAIRKAASDLGKQIGDMAVLMSKVKGDVAPVMTNDQRALVHKFIKDNDGAFEKFFDEASKKTK
jgi:Spy/CpxP family protein refolding chaperone